MRLTDSEQGLAIDLAAFVMRFLWPDVITIYSPFIGLSTLRLGIVHENTRLFYRIMASPLVFRKILVLSTILKAYFSDACTYSPTYQLVLACYC